MRVPGFSAWDQSDAFEPEKGATSPSDHHARNAVASLLGCDTCQVNTTLVSCTFTWDSLPVFVWSTPRLVIFIWNHSQLIMWFEWVSGQDFLHANWIYQGWGHANDRLFLLPDQISQSPHSHWHACLVDVCVDPFRTFWMGVMVKWDAFSRILF